MKKYLGKELVEIIIGLLSSLVFISGLVSFAIFVSGFLY
ncbi:MAG: hypothetical protein UV36_C0033G0006 [Parcubacteria group bacterium GW2011_GWC2_42_6]|nr:MAG: hypothetical protein UU87_C0004G0011 [Parcubacteria group bacterium GW2011_GWA2_42_11]KKS66213.1 MAG: hypothetical protein UV36_C0033G0006 [Parcubacteria group bacterium GW2011_GWC2_42_6]KKT76593.1 MAG: hypothetical protein UW72_C0004G0014 [Parcubacteria group bacterium GW2011_GWF2_44_7]